jgi:hypothetical protein
MTMPPVLLLVFNRPDHLRSVMAALRLAKPKKLYVAADGPRQKAGEFEACEEARAVATQIDWQCDVQTLFRDGNLGCRVAVSTAIDWFFTCEEQGIILEDDCVPSQSFFPYCADLLERYRGDTRVMCVSGDNFQQGRQVTQHSYYFSKYMHCWGWATWRRAWALYDRDMALWPEFKAANGLRALSDGNPEFESAWSRTLDSSYLNKIDSWAYRYLFSCWANNGLTCLPAKNLVSNIGFDEKSTHTKNSQSSDSRIAACEINFPLSHPPAVFRNADADKFEDLHVFNIREKTLAERVRGRIRSLRKNIKHYAGVTMRPKLG